MDVGPGLAMMGSGGQVSVIRFASGEPKLHKVRLRPRAAKIYTARQKGDDLMIVGSRSRKLRLWRCDWDDLEGALRSKLGLHAPPAIADGAPELVSEGGHLKVRVKGQLVPILSDPDQCSRYELLRWIVLGDQAIGLIKATSPYGMTYNVLQRFTKGSAPLGPPVRVGFGQDTVRLLACRASHCLLAHQHKRDPGPHGFVSYPVDTVCVLGGL